MDTFINWKGLFYHYTVTNERVEKHPTSGSVKLDSRSTRLFSQGREE